MAIGLDFFGITSSGKALITRTLSAYQKTKQTLERGVQECNATIDHIDDIVEQLEEDKKGEQAAIMQATAAITQINKILGEDDPAGNDIEEHN